MKDVKKEKKKKKEVKKNIGLSIYIFFGLCRAVCRILVSRPEIELIFSALGAQGLKSLDLQGSSKTIFISSLGITLAIWL